jgi:hypothetical protein
MPLRFARPAVVALLCLTALWSYSPAIGAETPSPALAKQAMAHGAAEIIFALRQPVNEHWYANFAYYADREDHVLYRDGGKLCRLNLATRAVTTLLDDKLGGVRDPVVHYDAHKILFSYRKGGTPNYHLYEIDVDGSHLRQLTDGPYDDIEPCYLPDGRIVFVSTRAKRWVNCWLTKVAILHRCDADGGHIRPISANIEQDNTPWVLPDGRIMYMRWEYVDRSQVDYHHLWTSNPDGTAPMTVFGNLHPGTAMLDAKPVPGSRKVVVSFSPGHGQAEHNGFVTLVDPRRGPDEPQAAAHISPGADCRDPWAFSEHLFLAARYGQVELLDDQRHVEVLYKTSEQEAAAGLQCHEPRPLMPRKRETVIADRTDLSRDTGTLLLMDVYHGRNMTGVRRGEIKKLLVLESLPKPINYTGGMDPLTYGGSFTLERVLGTVPVDEDGSAAMEVPALRSLFFVALDENNMAVKRMQSFTSVQPGEVTSCVGCHERRTESPALYTQPQAAARRPSRIEPAADCPEVFDFPRDIQPILDRQCGACHGCEKTARGGPYAGKVLLTGDHGPMFSHAYVTMTIRRLFSDNRNQPRSNYPPRALGSAASRILTMLDGSHHGVRVSAHERDMLRLWIEVGAPYPGTYAALGCGSIGGYYANGMVNGDWHWPTTKDGAAVIDRRCASCHQGDSVLPRTLCDERNVSFWRFGLDDPRLRMSRHLVFNLSRPEKSLMLLAPLAERAGGWALCRDANGRAADVFRTRDDPDYAKLLAMVAAGRANLEQIKRFDMPGFRPTPQYLREMKHYGILPGDHDDTAAVDCYDLDRRYWQSLWFRK